MSTTASKLPDEEWQRFEAAIETFSRAWTESQIPPMIADFLATYDESWRTSLMVELVKIDVEQRWRRGVPRLIEDYAAELPELQQQISPELVLEEFRARRLAGDLINPSEFTDRFPQLAESLEKLVALDPTLQSLVETIVNTRVAHQDSLEPGDAIDDFDLLLILGKGAFATVFLARQRSLQRIVAVKVSEDRGNEPQTLAQLDHNNIVRIYDQRSLPDRGLRLLYMQYAAGGTLANVLQVLREIERANWNGKQFLRAVDRELDARGESPLTGSSIRQKLNEMTWPQVVCWIAAQLSRALNYAHRQGVLHRDLKPANVLLTSEGVPKLADFNISFSARVAGSSPVAYFGGSLAYMSPEQLEACDPRHERTAESLDERSDLFSLGVVIWELLTGELPFADQMNQSGTFPRLRKMIQSRRNGPPERPSIHPQDLGLYEILCRCLASRPEDRFQTGLDLAHELELCLQPEAKNLLSRPTRGWRYWSRRFPLFAVVIVTLIPNLIGAVFNFLYNHNEILERLPAAEPTFMRIQTVINLITFPTGIMSASWLAGSIAKATQIRSQDKLTPAALLEQRRRCLNLGNVAAIVGLSLWLIAAPAYPLSLHFMLGSVPVELYIHFVASLAICGLIAAAFPFFWVSLIAVRCFYPSLMDWESMTTDDRASLQRLARQTWFYLVLAAAVPMVAVVILVIAEPNRRAALIVLAAGGAIGYGIAVSAFRIVQADIATLIRAICHDDRGSA